MTEDAPAFPAPPTRDRRVVVQWPDGQWQIVGYTDKQPADIMGSVVAHGLIACRRSYYLYRPIVAPEQAMENFHGDGTFKADQQ